MNPGGALNILLSQGFIQVKLLEHAAHVIDSHPLAVGADRLKEELDVVRVLHIGLALNQGLILQNVCWGENCLPHAAANVKSLSDTLQEDLKLGGLVFEAKSSIAIDYLFNFQQVLIVLIGFTSRVNLHNVQRVEVLRIRKVFESFFKLLSTTVASALDDCRFKLLAKTLEVPRVVIERHFYEL